MRARQERGNRPALGRAKRKGDPKRAVRKRGRARGQEGPREGGPARIEEFPAAPYREEPGLRPHAVPAALRTLRHLQDRDPTGSARTPTDPTPNLPRTAGIRHPRRRGSMSHARAARARNHDPHEGGDPRESHGSTRKTEGARATRRAARRPPAPTRRSFARDPRPEHEYAPPPVQGWSRAEPCDHVALFDIRIRNPGAPSAATEQKLRATPISPIRGSQNVPRDRIQPHDLPPRNCTADRGGLREAGHHREPRPRGGPERRSAVSRADYCGSKSK